MANPAGGLKDIRRIVRNNVNTVELGERLSGHGDENASLISTEHILVCAFAFLSLEKDIHLNLAVLVSSLGVMDVTATI